MAPTVSLCCHCHRRRAELRKRGLCWACHRDPTIRALYPHRIGDQWRTKILDGYGERALPAEPTFTEPGSEARLTVLCARAAAGLQLHHPQDLKRICSVNLDSFIADAIALWVVTLPDGRTLEVRARTRAEARTIVKRELGLTSKQARLPLGTTVRPARGG